MLKVNEIFRSIQGEGLHAGRSAVFLRLAGCNLSCDFCDTDHSTTQMLSPEAAVDIVLQAAGSCRFLVVTGGEPGLQLLSDEGRQVLMALGRKGFYIAVETNGTVKGLGACGLINWVCVSPKADWALQSGHELKVVYNGQDLSLYQGVLDSKSFDHYWLQPMDGLDQVKNLKLTIQAINQDPRWGLSLQIHKIIGVR